MRPPTIIVSLVHIFGPLKGEIQELTQDTIRIGRHPSNDVLFPADLTAISRKHAEIIRDGNRFRLIDKSANGTFINGKKVTEAFLKDGDVLEFAEGGPKASFLTQVKEDQGEDGYPPVEAPMVVPASAPSPSARVERAAVPPLGGHEPGHYPQPEAHSQVSSPPRPESAYRTPPLAGQPQSSAEILVQTVAAPLIIQYGPTVRSYKEVPVTIGRHLKCGFVLDHPGILDYHGQIFCFQGQYWVKDLTGQRLLRVNMQPISRETALMVNDVIAFGPSGPAFRFMGEGRLAEVEQEALDTSQETGPSQKNPGASPRESGRTNGDHPKSGVFSRVKKKLF
jgi:pSer/pThr/pTyr-binding forkhead associated (FHA) protein